MSLFGLGRRFAIDVRDLDHRVRQVSAPLPKAYRYWNANGWWGDQGSTPQCVAYAWTHWLEDGPITQPGTTPVVVPGQLYAAAQKVDEWEGEAYDGTSVRAGAKVLQSLGLIAEYQWAYTLDEVARTVLEEGPMVVGTNWYDSMFEPDEAGFLEADGRLAGGHAWVIDGVNTRAAYFRMKNSWGRGWGTRGFALVSFETFDRLLHEDGEACIAKEIRK